MVSLPLGSEGPTDPLVFVGAELFFFLDLIPMAKKAEKSNLVYHFCLSGVGSYTHFQLLIAMSVVKPILVMCW
jgi:hypothetical protein